MSLIILDKKFFSTQILYIYTRTFYLHESFQNYGSYTYSVFGLVEKLVELGDQRLHYALLHRNGIQIQVFEYIIKRHD